MAKACPVRQSWYSRPCCTVEIVDAVRASLAQAVANKVLAEQQNQLGKSVDFELRPGSTNPSST